MAASSCEAEASCWLWRGCVQAALAPTTAIHIAAVWDRRVLCRTVQDSMVDFMLVVC